MPKDIDGKELLVGQRVVRPRALNQSGSVGLEIAEVTKINNDKVYLNGSSVPLKYNDRIAIIL
jgi:hypothetical protein